MAIPDIFIIRPKLRARIKTFFTDFGYIFLALNFLIPFIKCIVNVFNAESSEIWSWSYSYFTRFGYGQHLLAYILISMFLSLIVHHWAFDSEVKRKHLLFKE